MSETPGELLSPPEIMASLLESMPVLATSVSSLILPVHERRDAIRELLKSKGMISEISTPDSSIYEVGATDGAFVVAPMIIGDHVSTLSVAVSQGQTGQIGVVDHCAWSDFRSHGSDVEDLAKAMMMLGELKLVPRLGDEIVKIIDGSHATHLIALNMALGSADPTVRNTVLEAAEDGLVEAVDYIFNSPMVVACPKSDSSTAVWDMCRAALGITGPSLNDKALASLILESGEVLSCQHSTPSWDYLSIAQSRVSDRACKALSDRLAQAATPLTSREETAYLAKPHDATTVVRIETTPGLDDFEAADLVVAVCADVQAPFIQEPLSQFVADIFAKTIAPSAEVQMESLRLDLAESGETANYLEYLIRHYRTNF